MKKSLPAALIIGITIGFAVTAVTLGLGVTHIVCNRGSPIGWSGTIASPYSIALAPPGGFVNASYSLTTVYNSSYRTGESGSSDLPMNSSWADIGALNWTLYSEGSSTALGWGSQAQCNGVILVPGPFFQWSCGGCVISPPATPGVGQRLVVPPQFYNASPSAVINASYGPAPAATFTWSENQTAFEWSSPEGVSGFPGTAAPFSEFGRSFGIGITTIQSAIQFGVPIHLLSGGSELIPASFPQDWPAGPPGGTTMTITMTYVLPMSSGQGTWAVYLPGNGGPYSPGGLVFEQIS